MKYRLTRAIYATKKKVRIHKELMFARLRVDQFCGRSTKPREDMKKTGLERGREGGGINRAVSEGERG